MITITVIVITILVVIVVVVIVVISSVGCHHSCCCCCCLAFCCCCHHLLLSHVVAAVPLHQWCKSFLHCFLFSLALSWCDEKRWEVFTQDDNFWVWVWFRGLRGLVMYKKTDLCWTKSQIYWLWVKKWVLGFGFWYFQMYPLCRFTFYWTWWSCRRTKVICDNHN